MTKIEDVFLKIIEYRLHPGIDQASETDPPELTESDWIALMDTAGNQSLFPLVYDAANDYPSFVDFDAKHPEYFAAATAAVAEQMRQTDAFLSLYKTFLDAGLSPVVMKGIICRSLYGEKGDFRPSGDEDILIEKKDYKKTAAVLESCGYRREGEPDRKMAIVQEVTFCGENLTVELHLNPFGTDSAVREKMNDWFRDACQSEETVEIRGVPVRTMTPTDHFLFLVFHAFKHFTAGGFGIRMMLDILLFAEKYGEKINREYVNKGLRDVGASEFLADLTETGNRYLGFSLEAGGNSLCPDELLSDMFRTGTFGNSSDADHTAGRLVADAIQKGNIRENRGKSCFRMLFPSWKTWTSWKPYLMDRPWMVVPEWFRRLGRYFRGETSMHNMKGLDASYKIAEERMGLLKKYGVL